MPIGSLMLDLEGLCLTAEERTLLANGQVGGVILFSRNYRSAGQLGQLVAEIREIRSEILIAVDHEGGRVQRFQEGFTRIPAMRRLGELYDQDQQQALELVRKTAWLLATELLARDIDLSFAPVLDLDHALSQVIGDRAFSKDSGTVVELGRAFIDGFHDAGMAATGKHFPGHGGVVGDSHNEIPVDNRSLSEIEVDDLVPFKSLARSLDALMPAHVIYAQVDQQPAGFSKIWLQEILRKELGFDGVIFSDDLSMEGASVAGSYAGRAEAALQAGCDMVLVCNNRAGAVAVLDYLNVEKIAGSPRLAGLKHHATIRQPLAEYQDWLETVAHLKQFG